jgi:MerR family transcriptional regulator, light-induced transcriptional regulator
MNRFTIKDIENLTGIKSHTLRIWEQRYGIPSPKRTATNIRYYDDEDLKLLLNVSMLNKHGYKISKLTVLSKEELEKLALSAAGDVDSTTMRIDCLLKAMFNVDEAAFERVLSTNLMKVGMEKTMTELFFPFMNRIGVLWQTGQVNAAFEHFMSNLIRQKLIVAIDALSSNRKEGAHSFALFLPEGEMHELGLLFTNYMLRSRGHSTVYLGQNLPHTDLGGLLSVNKTEYLITVVTSVPEGHTVQTFINDLSGRYPGLKLILTGYQIASVPGLHGPKNVIFIRSVPEMISFIEKL